jgi:large subunit ribosomal protein L25
MPQQEVLNCSIRNQAGTGAARKLRASGVVPGVVYSKGQETQTVGVLERELIRLLHAHHGRAGLVSLAVEGNTGEPIPAVLKEMQRDPVSRRILSVDFQQVSLTERMRTEVAVRTVGIPAGVKVGGVLELVLHEVEVECLPTALPEALTVDVSALDVGDSLPVSALQVPEGVSVVTPAEDPLVTVLAPKVTAEEAAAEAAAVAAAEEPEVIGRGAAEEEEEEQ